MSVRLDGEIIRLDGDCRVEEAEPLAVLLQQNPGRTVDLSACEALHGAVAQVLLGYRAQVTGAPTDPFLRDFVLSSFGISPVSGN